MADLRSKALACLRSGRVTVTSAVTVPGTARPCHVEAFVTSTRPGAPGTGHRVRLDGRAWECSCGTDMCAHLLAVQMVTGHALSGRPAAQAAAVGGAR